MKKRQTDVARREVLCLRCSRQTACRGTSVPHDSERYVTLYRFTSRSQWPRGLRRRSAAARLLWLWVRIPPGGMDGCVLFIIVCCQVEVSATS